MKNRTRIATIRFDVFGSDENVRSQRLAEHSRTIAVTLADATSWDGKVIRVSARDGLGVAVVVTLYDDHRGIVTIQNALGYAVDELAAGVVEAGGSLGDGTHVQIRRA